MPVSTFSLGLVDAVARPSSFVQSQVDTYTDDSFGRVFVAGRLSFVYILNLLLYAGPLTLSGFGRAAVSVAPGPLLVSLLGLFFSDVVAAFDFTIRLLQNSAFLFVASVLIFITFHIGLLITRSSAGMLQSIHTVTFSVGIYLAAVFTLVWYLSTADGIVIADDWLIALQKSYIYFFIDLFSFGVELPGGRPDSVSLSGLTQQGKLAIGALIVSMIYFIYTLYLGARINHHASRLESLIAVLAVAIAPAVYIIGSIVFVLFVDVQELLQTFIAT